MSRLLRLSLFVLLSLPLHAATFIVDDNGTASDAAIDGTCLTGGGVCTLRAAIEEANATAGLDVIHFSGSMTINESSLPSITQPVRLDGEANAVTIDGTTIAFQGTSDGSRLARLTISNSATGGVLVDVTTVELVANTISGNQNFGVRVTGSSATIGGAGDGEGNTITGTTGASGLEIWGPNADVIANTITSNAHGIYVDASSASIVGNAIDDNGGNGVWADALAAALMVDANHIGGNGGPGIFLNGTSGATLQNNTITGNNLGISLQDASSNTIQNNAIDTSNYAGIRITSSVTGASSNAIAANTITGNDVGIEIIEYGGSADSNRMSQNSVYGNVQTGVDLQNGANNDQAAPSITCISGDDTSTTFSGSLTSAPNTTYRIELFRNDACESSAGKTYLGFTDVTTDAGGVAAINVTLPAGLPVGTPVTATATDPANNTSEYSSCGFVAENAVGVSDTFAWEPDGFGTIVFTHTAVPEAASVDFTITDGTAISPADYTNISGTVTFAPCETTKTVNVTVVDDNIHELVEAATITLSNGATATLYIESDDPEPSATVADAQTTEGDSGTHALTFTMTLSNPSSQVVSVSYTTADGSATAGSDYVAANGTMTFQPGEVQKTFDVTINGDLAAETDETFTVAGATGTIVNDDLLADLSITKSGPASVQPNVPFDYTIVVTNNGPGAATNVTVTDVLPASLTLDATQGAACSGTTTVVCTIATLANGESATITLTAHATVASGRIENTATAAADQTDPSANASTAAVNVAAAQIPTLSEWMLAALAVLLGFVAMRKV